MQQHRRKFERRPAEGTITGLIRMDQSDADPLKCWLVDISPRGMGLIMEQELKPQDTIVLINRDLVVQMTVQWVSIARDKPTEYRVGLQANGDAMDILKELQRYEAELGINIR